MKPAVTVVVPYHRARVASGMLGTCLWSLRAQTGTPTLLVLPMEDVGGRGAWWPRQQGLVAADTPYVAYLDSDDWAYPDHIATLYWAAVKAGADYVYSYFTIHDMWEGSRPDLDPIGVFGRPFNVERPHQTTSTILIRRDAVMDAGIQWRDVSADRKIPGTELRWGEDLDFTLQCAASRLTFLHVPRRTWAWRVGTHNTSGLPDRGDAVGGDHARHDDEGGG